MDKSPSDPHKISNGTMPVPKEKDNDSKFSSTLDDQYEKAFPDVGAPQGDVKQTDPEVQAPIAGPVSPHDGYVSQSDTQRSYPQGVQQGGTADQEQVASGEQSPSSQIQQDSERTTQQYPSPPVKEQVPHTQVEDIQTTKEQIKETYPKRTKTKKGGCCNVTTCCMGSCGGCLFLIAIIAALLIFVPNTVSSVLNSLFNRDVSVPALTEVDLDYIEERLEKVTGDFGVESIILSEDEFNALAHKRLYEGNADRIKTDVRADFSLDQADLYVRFVTWMPWMMIDTTMDQEGQISVDSFQLGSIDMDKLSERYLSGQLRSDIVFISESGDIDIDVLFETILFEGRKGVEISTVEFAQDEVKFEIVSKEEDTESGRESPF